MAKMLRPEAGSARKFAALALVCFLMAPCVFAQPNADLEQVLDQMDAAAARFRTTEASFTWIQYNKVIDDIADTQKGKVYFRRSGRDIEMRADITEPDTKLLVFSGGKIQVYQPRIEQEDDYDAGTHKEEFESFLVLGFGGGGHDMLKAYTVKFLGNEKIGETQTAKLDLTPKSDEVKRSFAHIVLWIDPERGISIQQQLFEASGDYRLAKYSDIQVNQKISENAFKLKTSSKTRVVSH